MANLLPLFILAGGAAILLAKKKDSEEGEIDYGDLPPPPDQPPPGESPPPGTGFEAGEYQPEIGPLGARKVFSVGATKVIETIHGSKIFPQLEGLSAQEAVSLGDEICNLLPIDQVSLSSITFPQDRHPDWNLFGSCAGKGQALGLPSGIYLTLWQHGRGDEKLAFGPFESLKESKGGRDQIDLQTGLNTLLTNPITFARAYAI